MSNAPYLGRNVGQKFQPGTLVFENLVQSKMYGASSRAGGHRIQTGNAIISTGYVRLRTKRFVCHNLL